MNSHSSHRMMFWPWASTNVNASSFALDGLVVCERVMMEGKASKSPCGGSLQPCFSPCQDDQIKNSSSHDGSRYERTISVLHNSDATHKKILKFVSISLMNKKYHDFENIEERRRLLVSETINIGNVGPISCWF